MSKQTEAVEVIDAEVIEEIEAFKSEADKYPFLTLSSGISAFYNRAETLDDLLDEPPPTVGLMECTGKVVTLESASLAIGELDGRPTLYAVIDGAIDGDGERKTFTTGASAVMTQLNKAAQLGLFPFKCRPYVVNLGVKGRSDPLHLGRVDNAF